MKTKNSLVSLVRNIPSLLRRRFHGKRIQSFLRPRTWALVPAAAALLTLQFSTASSSFAGSATWKTSPATGNWSTSTNWTPATTPNGPNDTATFATSNVRFVVPEGATQVNSIVFNPGASPFTIALLTTTLTISGTGITNNSAIVQNFAPGPGAINFTNSATAGGANVAFADKGNITFSNTSTAGSAIFTSSAGGVTFLDTSTAGDAAFTNNGGLILFQDTSTAGNGTFSNNGTVEFFPPGTPTAGNGTFTNDGGTISGGFGGFTGFFVGTAGNATVIANGGAVSGAFGGQTRFNDTGDAGNATLIANGGLGGGGGGLITFASVSTGATARLELFGNGTLDLSEHSTPVLTTGSLEGSGLVFLGANNLTVGTNNLSSTFSGKIQDGGISGGTGGSLTKMGTGTLTLSGANTYTGSTTVNAGTLLASNTTGSATGTGAVKVNAGTLGGGGIISGPVTIGTGNGAGATLAPAGGTKKQATLTSLSALTFNSDATCTYTFKAKANKSRTDKVTALGVTINSGATFVLQGTPQGILQAGLVLTVVSNTSAAPINGSFSNLPDGAILTANGNKFQATYKGGDGNDLTLTVVP